MFAQRPNKSHSYVILHEIVQTLKKFGNSNEIDGLNEWIRTIEFKKKLDSIENKNLAAEMI